MSALLNRLVYRATAVSVALGGLALWSDLARLGGVA